MNIIKTIKIGSEEMLRRITVRPPYYALKNLELFNNILSAEVFLEQIDMGIDTGPITPGECSRHMTILGACLSAINNNDTDIVYYLPHKSVLRREAFKIPGINSDKFIARSYAGYFDKKTSNINTQIFSDNHQLIYSMDVEYQCLKEKVFKKLFNNHEKDMRSQHRNNPIQKELLKEEHLDMRFNPYEKPVKLDSIDFENKHNSATLGEVSAESCSGHFPMYPALPAAFLIDAIDNFNKAYINFRFKTIKSCMPIEAVVLSENLAFSGEIVCLKLNEIDISDDMIHLTTYAVSEDNSRIFCQADTLYYLYI